MAFTLGATALYTIGMVALYPLITWLRGLSEEETARYVDQMSKEAQRKFLLDEFYEGYIEDKLEQDVGYDDIIESFYHAKTLIDVGHAAGSTRSRTNQLIEEQGVPSLNAALEGSVNIDEVLVRLGMSREDLRSRLDRNKPAAQPPPPLTGPPGFSQPPQAPPTPIQSTPPQGQVPTQQGPTQPGIAGSITPAPGV